MRKTGIKQENYDIDKRLSINRRIHNNFELKHCNYLKTIIFGNILYRSNKYEIQNYNSLILK